MHYSVPYLLPLCTVERTNPAKACSVSVLLANTNNQPQLHVDVQLYSDSCTAEEHGENCVPRSRRRRMPWIARLSEESSLQLDERIQVVDSVRSQVQTW